MALTGTLYSHYSQVPPELWQWRSFEPDEPNLACPSSGEFYLHVPGMNALQYMRDGLGKPLHINSGHRSAAHNALVGGAPLSMHKQVAFDVSTRGHDRLEVYWLAKEAGFTGFGFYQNFLHCDHGRPRTWYGGNRSREIWDRAMHRGGR